MFGWNFQSDPDSAEGLITQAGHANMYDSGVVGAKMMHNMCQICQTNEKTEDIVFVTKHLNVLFGNMITDIIYVGCVHMWYV